MITKSGPDSIKASMRGRRGQIARAGAGRMQVSTVRRCKGNRFAGRQYGDGGTAVAQARLDQPHDAMSTAREVLHELPQQSVRLVGLAVDQCREVALSVELGFARHGDGLAG
jgi:hypothetical protein